jgi:pyrroline-5-carboxylate reductase
MVEKREFSIALVGAGNMGGALLGGWLNQGVAARLITVIDPSPAEHIQEMIERAGVRLEAVPPAGMVADVLVLAVKPQTMGKVLSAVSRVAGEESVVVSVAAGTTIAQLEAGLGPPRAVVRAMPNTPALVRRGISVMCANGMVDNVQRHRVDGLLQAVGSVEWVSEEGLIDAVTALSGSGPAYVFYLAECMAKAGVKVGLPEELAMKLACETVTGAGELLARSDKGPAMLRENVTSPKGTTAAALDVLMADSGLCQLMENAIAEARKRSVELSKS